MHNLSCENEFYLHENEKWFPYQRLSTYPRFETEARGNSEMAYWVYTDFIRNWFICLIQFPSLVFYFKRKWPLISSSGHSYKMKSRVTKCLTHSTYECKMIITISYPKCLRIIVGDYINCKAKAFFKDMLIAEFYWSRRNVTSLRKGMNHMSHISYTKALLVYLHWWNSLSRMSKGDNVRLYATVIPETFFGINVINMWSLFFTALSPLHSWSTHQRYPGDICSSRERQHHVCSEWDF